MGISQFISIQEKSGKTSINRIRNINEQECTLDQKGKIKY